jgi:hypothetical protein
MIYIVNGCSDYWDFARLEDERAEERFYALHVLIGLGTAYGRSGGWIPAANLTNEQKLTVDKNTHLITHEVLGKWEKEDVFEEVAHTFDTGDETAINYWTWYDEDEVINF